MRCWLPAVTVFFIFHQNADFSGKSFIIAFVRGGAGVVERDRLLSGYWDKTQSGVRIPPSPLKNAEIIQRFLIFRGTALNGSGDSELSHGT